MTAATRDRRMNDLFVWAVILLAIGVLVFIAIRTAQSEDVYRDRSGKIVAKSTTTGKVTTFRDGAGKTTATAHKENDRYVYRDSKGRTIVTLKTTAKNPPLLPNLKGK